jgi:anti-sigma-K factor RskA
MKLEPNDIPAIADEYVLGLLDEADRAHVEAHLERNVALRQAVDEARERFLPLDTGLAPVDVSQSLWQAISSRLPDQSKLAARDFPNAAVAANSNHSINWRAAAITAMAASVVLAIGLTWSMTRRLDPLVVAVLMNEAGEVQAVVEDFGNDTANVRLLTDFVVPSDKTMQVWTLPSVEMGPMSLGLLDQARSAKLAGWSLPKPADAQLYEITLENEGGSPTNRPTGPILAKGYAKLTR